MRGQTRGFLHAAYAANHGATEAIIYSSDTDDEVVVASLVESIGLTKLWTGFGRGKYFRWIPIHEVVSAMGPHSIALPFFCTLSGCDTVSPFQGKGKRSA